MIRMPSETRQPTVTEIATLLRGEAIPVASWTERLTAQRLTLHLAAIVLGAGSYGAAMGWWRDSQQALFVAIKFPLIILLTTAGNALINAMLAPLLGLNIPFRQTFSSILMSFVITASILGAFSPLIAFMVWNAPSIGSSGSSSCAYNLILLVHVTVIAFAGITGNARLFQLLSHLARSKTIALRVLFVWLAGNLFLGSQLSWIVRPFIGSPGLPVEFLRTNAFHGNFYEAVFHSFAQILNN